MFKRIVVGYAGDRAGRDAVRLAGRLAATLDSQLTVVFPYNPLTARGTSEAAEQRVRNEVRALLEDGDGGELPRGASDDFVYRWTPPPWPHGLHELAAYEEADLLVCGANGDRSTHHLHLGPMERMVHGAPCAVLIATPGHADDAAAKPAVAERATNGN